MSEITEVISSNDDLKKYRYETPNIIDDLDLSPHAFRIYSHYRRACGANGKPCTQSTKTIAAICSMSTGKVSEAKKELADMGLIQIVETTSKVGVQHNVTVTNIWSINFAYFDKQITLEIARQRIWGAVHNMNEGVQDMNDPRSQYELKKEHIIQERTIEESSTPATQDVQDTPKSAKYRLLTKAAKDELLPVLFEYGLGKPMASYTPAEITQLMKNRLTAVLKALQPLDDESLITTAELEAAYKWFKKQYRDASYPIGANTLPALLSNYRASMRQVVPILKTPALEQFTRPVLTDESRQRVKDEIEALRRNGA